MDSPFSGSGSPASSNASPPPAFYYRSDSVVVEKPPSHVAGHESPESIEFYSVVNGENSRVEVLVIDQSQPSCNSTPQSPGSGYSSNKTTDDEGDNEGELDEGFCDELGDEGFVSQLLVADDPTECPMIPTSALLEDFDLGVDMFDSTEQAIPTSEPLKSPFGEVPLAPGSPYQFMAASTSPVSIPPQDIQSQNDYNEYLNQAHSNASSSSSYSQHSSYMPTEDDDLAMLLCDTMTGGGLDIMTSTHGATLPLPISTCGQHTTACSTMGMDFSPHSVSYATSNFASQADPSFSTPTLTSVNMTPSNLMDLAEASQLTLTEDEINSSLINMAVMSQLQNAPLSSQTSSVAPILSDTNFSMLSSVNNSIPLSNVTNSVAGAQMCSRSSQTGQDTTRMTRSLSPAPSLAQTPNTYNNLHQCRSPSPSPSLDQYSIASVGSASTGACYYSPSPECTTQKSSKSRLRSSSASSTSSKLSRKMSPVPPVKEKLVDMPFYQFKKILDDPAVDVNDKEEAKSIRKRGKNKMAAKNCRQKKIEVVMGLQQEVEKMREQKKRLDSKCHGLEREINLLKQRCSSFHSLTYSTS